MYRKAYISVKAQFNADGTIMPIALLWNDKKYDIDRVLDVRNAASLKAGGIGVRFTCRILGKDRYLWLEENRWFVEERKFDIDEIF